MSYRAFVGDEGAATSIEYAIVASLIAVFIIAAVGAVGTNLSSVFSEIGNAMK